MGLKLIQWWMGALAAVLVFGAKAEAEISAGPLYDQFDLTLSSGVGHEALGPVISYEAGDSYSQWVVAPFVSHFQDAETDSEEFDILYPILTYNRFGPEYRFQILQWFSFSGGEDQEARDTDRFTLFPLYFQQRSEDPDRNYTAVVPFYGHIENRLFQDEIDFVMLPLYLRLTNRDVVTDHFLVPFFHRRHGDKTSGWKVWPLVGHETKEVTYRTNDWDKVETIGGHRKFFALWPLYFHNDIRLGTDNPEKQRVFLPFYSWQKSPRRDSLTLLWPLFTITDDREQGYREVDAPWPFIVFARGEGKTANRVWPLFSRVTTETKQDEFYLWPLYKRTRTDSEPLQRQRTRLLFFLYSDIQETNTATQGTRHRTDLWPLFTAEKDWEGNERYQLLALLEPLLPGSKSVVRNYSSLWSIWRSKKNPETGRSSQSLLWNLYRRDKTPATSKYSFLFGLVQFQSGPQGNRWRWFHWPQEDPPPESTPAGSNPQ